MPVTMIPMTGFGAMKDLGVGDQFLADLPAFEVGVKLTNVGFKFVIDGETKLIVPVSIEQLQQLKDGKLDSGVKFAMKKQLEDASLKMLSLAAKTDLTGGTMGQLSPMQPVQVLAPTPLNAEEPAVALAPGAKIKVAGFDLKPGVTLTEAWPEFDMKKLTTAIPVPLRDAKSMYQPVNGTSGSSRYFLVAGGDDLRIAARYVGTSLSVRIEGDGLLKNEKAVSAMGLKVANLIAGGKYASLHLEVGGDVTMASKTLGAILFGLGLKLDTPIPQLQLIAQKGK